jgi:hypothetical protein
MEVLPPPNLEIWGSRVDGGRDRPCSLFQITVLTADLVHVSKMKIEIFGTRTQEIRYPRVRTHPPGPAARFHLLRELQQLEFSLSPARHQSSGMARHGTAWRGRGVCHASHLRCAHSLVLHTVYEVSLAPLWRLAPHGPGLARLLQRRPVGTVQQFDF